MIKMIMMIMREDIKNKILIYHKIFLINMVKIVRINKEKILFNKDNPQMIKKIQKRKE